MKDRVHDDVGDDNGRQRYVGVKHGVQHGKTYLQQQYADQCLVLGHAAAQQLVMDVTLVGLEQWAMLAQTCDDDADDIKARHDEQCVGDEQTVTAVGHDGGVVFGKLDDEKSEDESQGQTARVAHENLVVVFCFSKDIEIEKSHQYADKSGYHRTVCEDILAHETIEKARQGYHADTSGQSIDAVDEVESVVDEYDDQYREWGTDIEGDVVDTAKSVKVVDVESGDGQKARRYYLGKKLGSRFYAHDIVDESHGVDEDEAHDEHTRPKADFCALPVVSAKDDDRDNGGKQHAGNETGAAEPWYGTFVYLTGVGQVVEIVLDAEFLYSRYEHKSAYKAYDKGNEGIYYVLRCHGFLFLFRHWRAWPPPAVVGSFLPRLYMITLAGA